MSGLGTDVQNVPVAAIGQADDTGLVSNDIIQLQHLLQLTLQLQLLCKIPSGAFYHQDQASCIQHF